ncbi:MAG: hypothetical protein H7259_10305 [Cytophagales bacterium]|nr:hypothetical protein [Cytophaga sp.]
MNILTASILFILVSFSSFSQIVHVSLIDATTNKPVTGVKIKSYHDHDLITFSNDSGYFAFNLKHSDTILIQKDYYYPVYMTLATHHFDSTHVIRIPLTPSETVYNGSDQFKKMNLQTFEYHFTHDAQDDSDAKITLFQTKDELTVQKEWTEKSLKFATVDVFKHTNDKSSYVLSQPKY